MVNEHFLKTGERGNILITNDKKYGGCTYSSPLIETVEFIKEFLLKQKFVKNVKILEDNMLINKKFINLNIWRNFLHMGDILNVIKIAYNLSEIKPINFHIDEKDEKDIILFSETFRRKIHIKNIDEIIKKNKCYFLTSNIDEYNNFIHKDKIELILAKNLEELFYYIQNCKMLVCAPSLYACIAIILNKKTFVYVNNADGFQYLNIEKYMNNINYKIMESNVLRINDLCEIDINYLV